MGTSKYNVGAALPAVSAGTKLGVAADTLQFLEENYAHLGALVGDALRDGAISLCDAVEVEGDSEVTRYGAVKIRQSLEQIGAAK